MGHNAKSFVKELNKNIPTQIDEKVAFESGGHLVTEIPVKRYGDQDNEKIENLGLLKELKTSFDKDGDILGKLDPEEYFSIWKNKYEEYQKIQYFRWLFNNIDSNDPYQIEKVQELFPEYYQEAEKAIDETADMYERLAQIQYNGIRSRDDWFLVYNIAHGKVQFDVKTLEKIMGINLPDTLFTQDFEAGILNPRRYRKWNTENTIMKINPWKPFLNDGKINTSGEINVTAYRDVLKGAFNRFFS